MTPAPEKPKPQSPKALQDAGEISWRVEQCWAVYLTQRQHTHKRKHGTTPGGREPSLTGKRRRRLEKALAERDRGLLGGLLRDQWEAESVVRAAIIGLFLDHWFVNAGKLELERVFADTEYDGIERFSKLYFDARRKAS